MKDNLKPSEVNNYRVLKIEGNIGLSASVFDCGAFVKFESIEKHINITIIQDTKFEALCAYI